MEKNALQYIVLTFGTISFALLLYFIVDAEKKKNTLSLGQDELGFNQVTTGLTIVYSKPDNNSSVITTVASNTKVQTNSQTKFYFRISKIEGNNNVTDGYISKRQLKRLK